MKTEHEEQAEKWANAHLAGILEVIDSHGVQGLEMEVIKNAYLFVFKHAFAHGVKYMQALNATTSGAN